MNHENTISNIEKHSVDGFTIDHGNLMISLKRVPFNVMIMSKCLDELAAAGVNVDIISRTAPVDDHFDVSLVVFEHQLPLVKKIVDELQKLHPEMTIIVDQDITRLSLHGIGMRTQSGVAARFFQAFADAKVPVQMITTSEICISCIIKNEDVDKAATEIRKAFDL